MGLPEGITRNVFVLGIVSFLTDVSSEMVFPILSIFLSVVLGAGKEVIGLVEGVGDSIASLTDIIFGYWSDRIGGRKRFVVAGYGLSSVLKAGLLFANAWPQVLLIRGFERLGKSMRTPARDAIIAASADKAARGKAFGFHRMMDTLGAIAGPAVAFVVLSTLGENEAGFRMLFTIALIPAFLAVLTIVFFVKEPKAKTEENTVRPGFWASLRALNGRYKRFLGISCLFSLAYFSFALLMLRAVEIGLAVQDTLLAYLIFNGVYALSSVPIGALSDRIGRKPVIAAAFVLFGIVCAGFIYATGIGEVIALFAVYGLFVAADESVNKAHISDMTDEKTRGVALGAYSSAVGAVYLPANALFGMLWAVFGAPVALGAAAVIAVSAGALMLAKG